MGTAQSKQERVVKWWEESSGSQQPPRIVTIEWVARNARPGDYVLCKGDGIASSFISCNSPHKDFSHVMVFVPGRLKGQVCLSDAYEVNAGRPVFRSHGDNPKGVQFVDIEERLRNYDSGRLVFRQMNRSFKIDPLKINLFRLEIESWTEATRPWYFKLWFVQDFMETGYRLNNDSDVHFERTAQNNRRQYYVCTTWAARALQMLGVFEEKLDPGNFNLGDFAQDIPSGRIFGSHARYGPFCYIDPFS